MNKFTYFFWVGLLCKSLYANDWDGSPLGIPSYRGNLQKIESERFILIFDSLLHPKLAQLYAFFLERSFASLPNTKSFFSDNNTELLINKKYKKFPIILSQHSSTKNSYVNDQLSFLELYPPGTDPLLFPWVATLSIHEVRHILQTQVIKNSPFYKATAWLMGPLGAKNYAGFGLPHWFSEGDAVYWESKFSSFGRGHNESFLKDFLLEISTQKKNSYYQDVFKSYSHTSWNRSLHSSYILGYFFSKYFVENYGYKIYSKILDDTTKNPSWPGLGLLPLFGFEFAVLNHTKIHLYNHYKKMVDHIKNIPIPNEIPIETKPILQKHLTKIRASFFPIKQLPKKSLLAFQSRKFGFSRFVEILPNGTIKPIKTIFGLTSRFSAPIKMGSKYILIAEQHPHFRWGAQDELKYSTYTHHGKHNTDLILYEYPSWKKSSLIKNRKILSFAIAPNDEHIIFVEQKSSGERKVVLLDISSKNEKILFDNLLEELIQCPIWSSDSKSIYFLQKNLQNMQSILFKLIQIDIQNPIPKVVHQMGIPFFPLTTSKEYLFYSINHPADPGIFAINLNIPNKIFKIIDNSFFYSKNTLLLSTDESSIFLIQPNKSKYNHIYTAPLNQKNWIPRKNLEISIPILNNIKENPFSPEKFIIQKYKPSFKQLAIPIHWGISYEELPTPHTGSTLVGSALHHAYGMMLQTSDQIGSLYSKWTILFQPRQYILSESISLSYLASTPAFEITLINQNQLFPQKQILDNEHPLFRNNKIFYRNKKILYHSGALSLIINPNIPLLFRINPGIYELEFHLPSSGTIIYDANISSNVTNFPSVFYYFQIHPQIHNSFFFIPYGMNSKYLELSLHFDMKIRIFENVDQPRFLLRDPVQYVSLDEIQQFPKDKILFGSTLILGSPGFYKYDNFELMVKLKHNFYLEPNLGTKINYCAPIFINWSFGPVIGLQQLALSISLSNQFYFLNSKNKTSPSNTKNFLRKNFTVLKINSEPKFILFPASKAIPLGLRLSFSFKVDSVEKTITPTFDWLFNFSPLLKRTQYPTQTQNKINSL